MIKKLLALGAVTAIAVLAAPQLGHAQEYLSGMKWDEPKVVTPGKTSADPPSDAIILFDGKDLSAWENGDKWIDSDVQKQQNAKRVQVQFASQEYFDLAKRPEAKSWLAQSRNVEFVLGDTVYEVVD